MNERRTQIKVYAGSETVRKWNEICQRFTGNTAAFAVMVERFHAQMNDGNTVNAIRYGFHAADLFEGWQDDDPEKYDERASAAKYAEQVEAKLCETYPGVGIAVDYDFGASGVLPESLKPAVDTIGMWETDHDEIGTIEHIAGEVYQSFEWCVRNE